MKKNIPLVLLIIILLFISTDKYVICKNSLKDKPYLKNGIKQLYESKYDACLKCFNDAIKAASSKKDNITLASALLWKSRCLLELCLYDKARKESEKSLEIYKSINDPNGIFSSKLVIVNSLFERERKIEAHELFTNLEKSLTPEISKENRIDFFIQRGRFYRITENFELCEKNYNEALRLSNEINDKWRSILTRYYIAQFFYIKRDYKKSIDISTGALMDARSCNYPYLMAMMFSSNGITKIKESSLDDGLSYFIGALTIFENIGNVSMAGLMYEFIADVFQRKSKWILFNEYINKAIESYSNAGNSYGKIKACYSKCSQAYITGYKKDLEYSLAELIEAGKSFHDPCDKAWIMVKEGDIYQNIKNDPDKARKAFENAEKIYSKARYWPGVAQCLVKKGTLFLMAGKYEDAIKSFDQALGIDEKINETSGIYDKDYILYCNSGNIYNKKATAYLAQSLYKEAKENYAKAISEDKKSPYKLNLIQDRAGMIVALLMTYDTEEVEKQFITALDEIREIKNVGVKAASYNIIISSVIIMKNSGSINSYNKIMSYKNSISSIMVKKIFRNQQLLSEVMAGYKELLNIAKNSNMDLGTAYILQGQFFYAGGKNAEAMDSYTKGIELCNKANYALMEGIGYYYISQLFLEEDRVNEAEKALKDAIDVYRKANLPAHETTMLIILAYVTRISGKYEEALGYFNEALNLVKNSRNETRLTLIYMGKGYTYHLMKKYQDSTDCYNKALDASKNMGLIKYEAIFSYYIGKNLAALGKKEDALTYLEKALADFNSIGNVIDIRDASLELGRLFEESGNEKKALSVYLDALNKICESKNNIPSDDISDNKSGTSPIKLLFERTVSLLIKQGRFDEALKYFSLSGSYDLLNTLDLESIQVKDEKLKALFDKMNELGKKMSVIKNDLETGEDAKRKGFLSEVLADTRQEFFSCINEIRKNNPDYEQLLMIQGAELAELQKVIPKDTLLIEYYPAQNCLYIFIISKESFSIRNVEITRERLYGMITELRQCLERPESSQKLQKNRTALYNLLINPVKNEINKKKFIEIIPAGLLWYVPVEMLGKNEGDYLIFEHEIGYLYSSDILRLLKKNAGNTKEKLVAFGNPEGIDLPQTTSEVSAINAIFPESKVFIGRNATKETFINEAKDANIIHIATHSSLNRNNINKSFIQFAGKEGRLSLGDIYGLSLSQGSLVVLSSCDSALGDDDPGKEFASLASAFTIAGASSVIASLWKVEDAKTAILFSEFYRNLRNGLTKSEALRSAKMKLARNPETSCPYFWAGFILIGDWR